MGSLFRRIGRAVRASVESFGSQRYSIKGSLVRCPVCGGDEFVRTSGGPVSKPLLLRFNAPWLKLDSQSTHLICAHCTHILQFGTTPKPVADDSFPVIDPPTGEGP